MDALSFAPPWPTVLRSAGGLLAQLQDCPVKMPDRTACLLTGIKSGRGVQRGVPEGAPDDLVPSGVLIQVQLCRQVPKKMRVYLDAEVLAPGLGARFAMQSALNAKHFADEDAAIEYVEAWLWPDGPVCPHCGTVGEASRSKGKTTRAGLWNCRPCRKPFTV